MKKILFLMYLILCISFNLSGQSEIDSLIIDHSTFYTLTCLSKEDITDKSADEIYKILLNLDLKEGIEVPNKVLNKLFPHQVHVLQEKNIIASPNQTQNHIDHGHNYGGPPDYIIFTIILCMTFSVLIFLVSLNYFKSKTKIAEYQLVQTAIKNQQEIPLDFIKNRERTSDLKRAFLFILVGIGLMITLSILPDVLPSQFGLIPIIIGLGMLLTNKLMQRYD